MRSPEHGSRVPTVTIIIVTNCSHITDVTPYATLQAFRVLREAYYQQLEDKGDRNNKEVI